MEISASSAAVALRPGQRLADYRLLATIGEGAMGVVFRAERDGDPEVALKVLRPLLSQNVEYRRRFEREVRAAREVAHARLVPVLDAGVSGEYCYLALRLFPGGSLGERLVARGPLPVDAAVKVAGDIAAALDALHASGLVHRDVKPTNVMLDEDGRAALTDFGLAKGEAYTVLTSVGQVLGTMDYLAPELFAGEAATRASDVYALGCLVYECLTGEAPFEKRGLLERAVAHMEEEPADPRGARPDVSADLAWALLTALAKRPEERPTTATAYARMLKVAGWRA